MIAFDTDARVISLSFIAPVDACNTLTLTSSFESFSRDSFKASTDPSTSAFIITLSSLIFPSLIWLNRSPKVTLCPCLIKFLRLSAIFLFTSCLATFSFSTS